MSVKVSERASTLFCRLGYPSKAVMTAAMSIRNYVRLGMLGKAKKCIDSYERESGLFTNGKLAKGWEEYYNSKAFYYAALNQKDSAHFYYIKQLRPGTTEQDQYTALQGLAKLYQRIGLKDSVAKYAYQAMMLNDTINNRLETEEMMRINNLYDYKTIQKKASHEEKVSDTLKLLLWIFAVVAIVIIYITYSTYRAKIRKRDEEMRVRERDYMSMLSSLNVVYQKTVDDNATLKNKIDEQTASHLATVETLQETIGEYAKILHVESRSEMDEKLMTSDIFLRFKKFRLKGELPKEKDWNDLIAFFDETIPNFRRVVNMAKTLSKGEYCLCMLTRLKFSPMDIDFLIANLCTSHINITVRRKRLLKKIWGKIGAATDFDRYICAIS